jgi:hypothetical protein
MFFDTYEYPNMGENTYDSDEEDIISDNFLKSLLFDNGKFKLYNCDTRDFINNIILWSSQRELNKDHVKTLKKSILNRGYLIGTMKTIKDKSGNIRCIDGQHRIQALKELMQVDEKFNCDIIIELYEVESFEDEEAVNLFIDANCNLNMLNNNTNSTVQKLIKKIDNEYPNTLIDVVEGKRCNRPRINKKEFAFHIKKLLIDYSLEDIFNSIKNLNRRIGLWNNDILRKKFGTVPTKMYEKTKNSGCYIGLYNDFKWIDDLEELYE